jgi:hypothetical protein
MKYLREEAQQLLEFGDTMLGTISFDGMSLVVKNAADGPDVVIAIGAGDLQRVINFSNLKVGYTVSKRPY